MPRPSWCSQAPSVAEDGSLPKPELGTDTLYRCLHAAKLHQKAKSLPVLVSGGPIKGNHICDIDRSN